VRRAVELQWPALLVASACVGLSLANWIDLSLRAGAVGVIGALVLVAAADGRERLAALALALATLGLAWGSLRMDALDRSVLREDVGRAGHAEVVTTAPARASRWATRVLATARSFDGLAVREPVLVVLPAGRAPPRGSVLDFDAKIAEPRAPQDGFDERAWLARQGVHVVLRAASWKSIGRRGGIAGLGDRIRDRVERAIAGSTDGVRRGVVLGVVLGEDEGLSERVRTEFRASGLYHLLAVSGQNVAFIAAGVYGLGWLLRLPRVARELTTLAAIVAYVLAVGWQPSVVRAGVAGALASLAWLAARPRDRWYFLAVGALVLLAWIPASALEPGFQLSFAAVAGIFVAVPRAQARFRECLIPPRLAEGLGVALVCGLVTAPVVLLQFGRAPLYTVPANVLAEPAMPLVLGLGLLAAVVDPIAPGASAALAWLAGWAAAWLALVAHVVGALPGAQVGMHGALVVAALSAGAWLVARRTRGYGASARPLAVACACLGLVAVVGWWALRPQQVAWARPGGLRVTFLDVGQGDSTLLETPSGAVLVDEGPPEARVADQLEHRGIRALSAIVLTHPQRDHVGGAAAVLRRLRVGLVLDPELAVTGSDEEEAMAAARERRVSVRPARTGDELRLGGLDLRVLNPPDGGSAGEDPNENAIVLVASYGETDVLLTADAESDVTAKLPLAPVEVLKVAHHGSDDPGLEEELRRLRPRIAVISVGRGNDYGHPRPETLAALGTVPGMSVYRTDEDGAVVVESDGHRLTVRAEG